MPPLTPPLVAGRLTLARQAMGMSKRELADAVGLTSAAIGQYESNHRTPSPEIIARIGDALDHPVAFFTRPLPDATNATPVQYRSLKSTTRLAREKAEAYLTYLQEAVERAGTLLRLPPVNLPDPGKMPSNPQLITEAMIEHAAQVVRDFWKMGDEPVPNMVWLLERGGCIITHADLSSDKLEALSSWRNGRPYIIVNTMRKNGFRARADIAHEIGHLMLHRYIHPEHFDPDGENAQEMYDLMEQQAWHFARIFLLPPEAFDRSVYSLSLDSLLSLKPRWKVSIAFMLQALKNDEVITPEAYVNARKNLARRRWHKVEPYDLETEPERPVMLAQMVEHLLGRHIQTENQLLEGTPMPSFLMAELLQVKGKYFLQQDQKFTFSLDDAPLKLTRFELAKSKLSI